MFLRPRANHKLRPFPGLTCRGFSTFGLDLRGLEDFAPLRYLAPDEVGEFLGRARRDVDGVEALAYVRSAEHLADIAGEPGDEDRKSTRLNSSHQIISYAVFCLKKKNKKH